MTFDVRLHLIGLWGITSSQGKRARTISDYDSVSFSTLSSNKARRVTDASLDPNHGSLCIQLDDDQNFPVSSTSSKRPCCSLCRWVETDKDNKNRSGIVVCDKCQVSLCVDCFKPFHTVSCVTKLRSEIMKHKLHEK
jgi:hypothetical protein